MIGSTTRELFNPKARQLVRSSYCGVQEPRNVSAPKRASCLIIGRHPQVPQEVKIICKQLTGRLQLGECCQHLNIIASGNQVMSPPEFEAAAGCSKGKNWKVRVC